MKKSKLKKNKLTCFASLVLVFLFTVPSAYAGQADNNSKYHVSKIETGYWVMDTMTKFNTKAMAVAFNHPNSGTKKVAAGQQVLGVQFALHNPGAKEIKVRRNDFHVNGNQINHFIVKEKKTQPLVVKVPAGKAIAITNYYIVDLNLSDIKLLKVVYSSVTKTYKKVTIEIPLTQEKK